MKLSFLMLHTNLLIGATLDCDEPGFGALGVINILRKSALLSG